MKSTVYLNKTAEELFQRAKEYDPDYTLSNAAEEGLMHFVEKMNLQYTGMGEQIAKKGISTPEGYYGSKSKFIGKRLAREQIQQVGPDAYEYQTLYLTKKGKYLLQFSTEDQTTGEVGYEYEVCHTVKELQEKAAPNLLTKAGNTAGELLEDLDI